MRGVAQIDPAGFVQDYTRSRMWTARFVRQFDEKDLDLTPGPGSMPTRDQIKQICQSDNFVLSLLNDEVPSSDAFKKEFDVSSLKACMASLKSTLDQVLTAAKGVNAEKWNEVVEPFGPDWKMTRAQLVYLMIDHESHHRGQLAVYLRVAGKTPEMLWNPVDESVFSI